MARVHSLELRPPRVALLRPLSSLSRALSVLLLFSLDDFTLALSLSCALLPCMGSSDPESATPWFAFARLRFNTVLPERRALSTDAAKTSSNSHEWRFAAHASTPDPPGRCWRAVTSSLLLLHGGGSSVTGSDPVRFMWRMRVRCLPACDWLDVGVRGAVDFMLAVRTSTSACGQVLELASSRRGSAADSRLITSLSVTPLCSKCRRLLALSWSPLVSVASASRLCERRSKLIGRCARDVLLDGLRRRGAVRCDDDVSSWSGRCDTWSSYESSGQSCKRDASGDKTLVQLHSTK